MSRKAKRGAPTASDVQGISRLVVAAVTGVTGMVEDLHRNVVGAPSLGGISGFVYRSIHAVTHAVGHHHHTALDKLAPMLLRGEASSPQREAALAVLNGVMGDYLVESGNPMATPMCLRRQGQSLVLSREALQTEFPEAGSRLLVLVHGLCMHDLHWNRDGHDHGAALACDLGCPALYVHYNSGLHVSTNGRELSTYLEQLVTAWPKPVTELILVGHSMGGLVLRSAHHYGQQASCTWVNGLKACIFLGTPHHGSPLERAGNGIDMLLETSPYTAPLARVGKIRSAGIQDLRHGSMLEEDWARGPYSAPHPVPLPEGVACYAIAATRQSEAGMGDQEPPGDGLVPVKSALGLHADPAQALGIPASGRRLCYGINHLDLLASQEVYQCLHHWLVDA